MHFMLPWQHVELAQLSLADALVLHWRLLRDIVPK
jgi:hypothetical protein